MILILVALITLVSGQVSVSWLSHSGMVTGIATRLIQEVSKSSPVRHSSAETSAI